MGSFRRQQLIISSIGSLLIIPYYLFFTLMFDFAAKAGDKNSGWEIAFKAFAFGGPIVGILGSFLIPRIAASWMLTCVGISLALGIGFQVHWAKASDAVHFSATFWAEAFPSILRAAIAFWLLPVLFGGMLIRPAQTQDL